MVYYYSMLNEMEKIFVHSVCVCVLVYWMCIHVCVYVQCYTVFTLLPPSINPYYSLLFFLPSSFLPSFRPFFCPPSSFCLPSLVHYILIYSICIILHMTSFLPFLHHFFLLFFFSSFPHISLCTK